MQWEGKQEKTFSLFDNGLKNVIFFFKYISLLDEYISLGRNFLNILGF